VQKGKTNKAFSFNFREDNGQSNFDAEIHPAINTMRETTNKG
jgi:hypothetical protein